MKIDKYKRECPQCGKELFSDKKSNIISAIKKNRVCKSCSLLGNKRLLRYQFSEEQKHQISTSLKNNEHHLRGKRLSLCQKEKLMEGNKNFNRDETYRKKVSISTKLALHRPDVRKKHIDALSKVNYLGRAIDIGQTELIKKWNTLGFNFEINYQLKTDKDLFYIDGYDKERRVIFEYDSKYHNSPYQKQKDLKRQQKIIELLNPKRFWRYNAETKQFRNIL